MHESSDGVFWIVLNAFFTREVYRPFKRRDVTGHKLPIKGQKKSAYKFHKEALVFELYLKAGNDRFYKIAGLGEFFHNGVI